MARQEEEVLKWEGKVTAKLNGPTAEQVWTLLEDFCNLHKWLPTIDTCYHVEGVNGQPGIIRYCALTVPSPSDYGNTKMVKWCKEKLLAIDPIKKCFSYEVLDNNMGIKLYVANLKVLPSGDEEKDGCQIEWSFIAEPIDGINTCEALRTLIDSSLQGMVKNMEKALQST